MIARFFLRMDKVCDHKFNTNIYLVFKFIINKRGGGGGGKSIYI